MRTVWSTITKDVISGPWAFRLILTTLAALLVTDLVLNGGRLFARHSLSRCSTSPRLFHITHHHTVSSRSSTHEASDLIHPNLPARS